MQAVLSSWKEIAQHLGKGVRTVQRWELEQGLPVHRPSTSAKGVVLAYPSDLDAWRNRASDEQRHAAWKRNHELSMELAQLTTSLRTSAQQLLNYCQAAPPPAQ